MSAVLAEIRTLISTFHHIFLGIIENGAVVAGTLSQVVNFTSDGASSSISTLSSKTSLPSTAPSPTSSSLLTNLPAASIATTATSTMSAPTTSLTSESKYCHPLRKSALGFGIGVGVLALAAGFGFGYWFFGRKKSAAQQISQEQEQMNINIPPSSTQLRRNFSVCEVAPSDTKRHGKSGLP
ncbi:uncharacterized protein RCO7_10449 [Rhynchosporium graminicola]|uniref:Mid2 domain-containing protein n=1 Tax=Rhynchosporium graminicola TaxID=2792576 RepID=A0A1E1LNY1_9HELO|nr:uncharacterized protein RCO7_10449 [Rhynchosporium commune]